MIRLNRKRLRLLAVLLLLLISATFTACQPDSTTENSQARLDLKPNSTIVSKETGVLTIWWYEGYVPAEKTFFEKIVRDWERENQKKIQLVFFDQEALLDEALDEALKSGATPDITLNHTQLVTSLAWEDKVKDVSAIIKPVINSFPYSVLKNSYQYNNVTKKKSYYAVPIYQEGVYLHYWQDMLQQLGYEPKDIPQDWSGFWQFWLTIQQQLSEQEVFGLGFTSSPYSTDTFLFFEHILEAYDVEILDSKGNLLINLPQTRQGIIKVLEWWTQFYQQGQIPPSALLWKNADNNSSFYNRVVAMTPNPTLSIPAARADEPDVYLKQLATLPFPRKPNGEPMTYITKVREALVFADRNFADAQSFLSYLIRPEIIANYIEAAGGRFFPVNKDNWDDPFWSNSQDPHISTVKKILTQSPTRPHYFSDSPAYRTVLSQNVWGQALYRILAEDISPEAAADLAIAQINQIFSQWQA